MVYLMKKTVASIATMTLLACASLAAAQGQRPPKPNLAEMASAMDVSEEALKGCLPEHPSREQSGERSRPPKPDPAEMAACLKKAGFNVTESKVTETLEAARPRRRQQQ